MTVAVVALVLLLILENVAGTVVAAKCSGGVVIGTDSLDTQGPLVGNRNSEKVLRVNSLAVLCLAAHNADVRNLCKELRREASLHRAHCGETLGASSLAHMARQLVHDRFPEAHVLVVGGEAARTAGSLTFSIHEVLPGGTRIEQDVAAAGSGSPTVLSLVQDMWSRDKGAVKDARETATRVRRAMDASIRVDPASGGDVALWLLSASDLSTSTVADTTEESEGAGSVSLSRL